MITAVDTSVLLDVFGGDAQHGPASAAALRTCLKQGKLIACDVVWAEVIAFFASADSGGDVMNRLGVEFSSLEHKAALTAGEIWREYRARGGKRQRVVADFLIGAHAMIQADRLLSHDRGFYRAYFKKLNVLGPGGAS